MLRSFWDVAEGLSAGQLVQVLADYSQEADVWAVYPTRLSRSPKVRILVRFLADRLYFSLQHVLAHFATLPTTWYVALGAKEYKRVVGFAIDDNARWMIGYQFVQHRHLLIGDFFEQNFIRILD